MPTLVFTDLAIRTLKAIGERTDFWDEKTPGFGIRVGKNTKIFIAKVSNRRITIGAFPDHSLADARRKAMALKSDKTVGSLRSVKFSAALQNFYDEHLPTLKENTQRALKRNLEKHFAPVFKGKSLDKISHKEIAAIAGELAKRTPSEAWHAFKDARIFFNWCSPRFIPHSPMAGLKSPTRYIPRKRVLTDSEMRAVWLAASEWPYPFGEALKLSLLTGCRWGEVVSLRWSYINERKRTVTLPDTKNGEEHTFPYGRMVEAIFAGIPRRNSTNLLFPGRDYETPWNGSGKAKWMFDKKCRIANWQILDLRRTFATKLAELAVPPHIVERLLNHKLGSLQTAGVITAVAAVYNRALYIEEMREAIAQWERHLGSLVGRGRLKRAA